MSTSKTRAVAGTLARVLCAASANNSEPDGEHLRVFVERHDPSAFAELVRRHGPMVLGVCLRVLRHTQDAEDAFQATFLVLARKAGTVSPRNAVGNWLYGVAHQTALRARAATMKRRGREVVVSAVPEVAIPEAGWDDLAAVLDEELSRLPDHYRAVIVLCDVEGRTRADAATQLGCPEGSVWSRLSRARRLLAKRLTKRGVTLPTGALALLVGQNATSAGLPASLVKLTVEAARLIISGSALIQGISPAVMTLTEGALKAMFITKLKTVTLATLALVLALAGIGGIASYGQADARDPDKPITKPRGDGERRAAAPVADDAKLLQGDWTVVESRQWQPIPEQQLERIKSGEISIRFSGSTILMLDGRSTGEKISLDTTKQPKEIHTLGADGIEPNTKLIYDLQGDTLRIFGWHPRAGDKPVAPKSFKTEDYPEEAWELMVLKREPRIDPDLKKLEGKWKSMDDETVFEFRDNKVSYAYSSRTASEGTFSIKSATSPKTIVLSLSMIYSGAEKYRGIYEFQNDGTLRIALDQSTNTLPKSFVTLKSDRFWVLTLKRQ